MKKLILGLVLVVIATVLGFGQRLHNPVQPYNENGYTLIQFESFASKPNEYSASYRKKLLEVVNRFLRSTKLYKKYNNGDPLDERWISWIFYPGRTWSERRVYENGFRNTWQSFDGKSVEWYWDYSIFDGLVMVLHLEGYKLDIGKTVCTNLVDVPYIFTGKIIPKKRDMPDLPEPKRLILPFDDYKPTPVKKEVIVVPTKSKTWVGKNLVWIIPTSIAIISGGVYLAKGGKSSSGGSDFHPVDAMPQSKAFQPPVIFGVGRTIRF